MVPIVLLVFSKQAGLKLYILVKRTFRNKWIKMKTLISFYYASILSLFSVTFAQNEIEWGNVRWNNNYYNGKDSALAKNKPVFLQFNEVPG